MTKTLCGFCESATKISREHVFGEWIGPILGSDQADVTVHHRFKQDEATAVQWNVPRLDQKVKMPCRTCNSGWMAALEALVRPILTPMILGRGRVALNVFSQVVIGTWAVKTAMVMEYLQKANKRYFTQAERTSVMADAVPSRAMGAHVWIGRYASKNDGVLGSAACLQGPNHSIQAHLSLFALGQFAVQVLVERSTAGQGSTLLVTRPGPWDSLLVEIWPPTVDEAVWPPARAVLRAGFEPLFSRFLALGAESPPHGPNRPV
jgi:hypothetical protein